MTKIDTQPEADKRNALQLAGALEDYMMAEPAIDPYTLTLAAAATELRRLHAENAAQAQQIAQDRADAARVERNRDMWKDQCARQAAQLEALRPVERRYQLLRRGQHWSVIDGIGNDLRGEALDAAIDAALAAQIPDSGAGPAMAKEARKLSSILHGMVEGAATADDEDIYASDYPLPDGDTFIYRAASLLNRMAAALAQQGAQNG